MDEWPSDVHVKEESADINSDTPLEDAGQMKLEPWDIVETDDGVWTTLEEAALETELNEKEENHPQDVNTIAPHYETKTIKARHIKTKGATWTESEKIVPVDECIHPQKSCPSSSQDNSAFKKQPKKRKRPEPKKTFKCAQCSFSSIIKCNLINHIRTHTGEKPYKCPHCSFSCIKRCGFVHHMRTHTGEKPYKCALCTHSNIRKRDLVIHIRTQHTGEKPHKCTQCTYSSARKGDLTKHMIKHIGDNQCNATLTREKPYKCSHCAYSSAQKNDLENHIRTHTGEKPYKCKQCSYSCAAKTHLIRHTRIHTGEKPYKCTQCSHSCSVKSSLITHMRKHS